VDGLPEHSIREHARAKRVRIKVSAQDGVEIIVPAGFDRREIPALLLEHAEWLDHAMRQVAERREFLEVTSARPERIALRAVGETWRVAWNETSARSWRPSEAEGSLLTLSGGSGDSERWETAAKKWVVHKAKERLIPWMGREAANCRIPIEKTIIRCQKTRWGSYSTRGTVSLNAQLMFLPTDLVRYVMIHEACHAIHSGHSREFWALVAEHQAGHGALRKALRAAWRFVPGWMING